MHAAQRYANLDFDRLLEQLAGYAGSELTRRLIREVEIEFHPSRVDANLDQTTEALAFLNARSTAALPPFSQLEDATELAAHLSAGELADPAQARAVLRFLGLCESFDKLKADLTLDTYPRLADVSASWQSLARLASIARRIFNDDGEVRDGASPALAQIRSRLARFEGEVASAMSEVLATVKAHTGERPALAIRGNRFVILVPRTLVGEVRGSILDVSGSGQHVYFEPSAAATLNTERQHLFLEEDQEVRRILQDFSAQVAGEYRAITTNLAIMAKVDFIFARARHADATRATRPRMNRRGSVVLSRAIHPLLATGFVPEDLVFEKERALVVSGVNAGGKTVLLKLLGLYCLMAALGMYVSGEAELPYISALHAQIGDEQSTLANLSTFTAHLKFVDELWRALQPLPPDSLPVLVLIDEVGTGTEPGEGAAFAYGLIEELLAYPVKLAVTTHYDLLKVLGLERDDVKNVCLEFDQQQLRPTFRILHDQPGQSFALAISRRWGIAESILSRAESVLGTEERRMGSVIGELERMRAEADSIREQAAAQAADVERLKRDNEKLNAELRQSKQRFAEHSERVKVELERRIDELLSQTKAKLRKRAHQAARRHEEYVKAASTQAEVVREQREEAASLLQGVLDSLAVNPEEVTLSADPVSVGDKVTVLNSNLSGTVTALHKRKGTAMLDVLGKRMEVALDSVRKVAGQVAPAQGAAALYQPRKATAMKLERSFVEGLKDSSDTLDLHGQTTEEAAASIEEFISRCLEANIGTLRLMHGLGSGRLRAFVQEYLRHHKQVCNVRPAPLHEGGYGVTLADLK